MQIMDVTVRHSLNPNLNVIFCLFYANPKSNGALRLIYVGFEFKFVLADS